MKSVIRIATTSALFLLVLAATWLAGVRTVSFLSIMTIALTTLLMIEMIFQSYAPPHSWSLEKTGKKPDNPFSGGEKSENLRKAA